MGDMAEEMEERRKELEMPELQRSQAPPIQFHGDEVRVRVGPGKGMRVRADELHTDDQLLLWVVAHQMRDATTATIRLATAMESLVEASHAAQRRMQENADPEKLYGRVREMMASVRQEN